jgi:hypothetical protein
MASASWASRLAAREQAAHRCKSRVQQESKQLSSAVAGRQTDKEDPSHALQCELIVGSKWVPKGLLELSLSSICQLNQSLSPQRLFSRMAQ